NGGGAASGSSGGVGNWLSTVGRIRWWLTAHRNRNALRLSYGGTLAIPIYKDIPYANRVFTTSCLQALALSRLSPNRHLLCCSDVGLVPAECTCGRSRRN
ncbi:MAG: hypothetical protein ACK5PZ_01385, partial [Pirellula sp.]